jgi:acetate---CoA ligase (ADP-forming)
MKLQSEAVLHKTELGAVRFDVSVDQAATVFAELIELGRSIAPSTPCAVLVQQTAEPGVELITGVVGSDDRFPPVLTLGVGGTAAELHRDRANAIVPIDQGDAIRLIEQLPLGATLLGYRGGPVYDTVALAELLVRLGDLALSLGRRLREVEINPIRVYVRGRGFSPWTSCSGSAIATNPCRPAWRRRATAAVPAERAVTAQGITKT